MAFLIVGILFIVGMMILIALSNVDQTGCVGNAGKCLIDQFKNVKVNGITINNSHDLIVLIVVVLMALLLAYLVVRLVKGNKSQQSEVSRQNTEKLPYWFDQMGNSQAIAAIYLLAGMAILILVGFVVFQFMVVQHGQSNIPSQINNNVNDFVMQIKIELWKLSQYR